MKKVIITSAIAIAMASAAAGQTDIRSQENASSHTETITYFLPMTEVVVTAEAELITEKPGPFYQYAERYLGIRDVISEEQSEWRLKDVRIAGRTVPDATREYLVMAARKGTSNNISYSPDGVIAGVNISEVRHAAADKEAKPHRAKDGKRSGRRSGETGGADEITFDMTQLNADALIAASIPKMAETAAQQIYHIRESRTALLTGDMETLPDGVALNLMLQHLDKAEAELTALFTGKRATRTEKRQFAVTPTSNMSNHVIFRLSKIDGIVAADDIMGVPYYLNAICNFASAPAVDKKAKTPKRHGFYYVVPGSAVISVGDGKSVCGTKTLTMPQLGYTTALPAGITDSETGSVRYNEHTGEIVEIKK